MTIIGSVTESGPLEPDVLGGPRMWFLVLSRQRAARIRPNVPHIVISITDPGTREAALADSPLRMGVLRLQFWDASEHDNYADVPSEEHAAAIVDFVRRHLSDADLIVTQCEAGISRSSGVAAALSRWLNGHDEEFFQRYIPNRLIYRLIRRALGDDAVMLPRL
ncbi:MAG: hypothetical protein GX446_17890 [Chthonomonadales bacterium]|nr:hypothetical protein [Chthonomonadales bacterium]